MSHNTVISLLERVVRHEIVDVVSAEPIIPAIAKRAAVLAGQYPDFVRADQGQVLGMLPDIEVPYGPSAGLPGLRALVADYWTHRFHLDQALGAENVCITTGATEALSITLRLVSAGQNVGINWIYWSNYKGIIRINGGNPVVLPIFDGDSFDFVKLKKLVKDQGIKTILVNFPANPSGEGLSLDEYRAFAEFAREMDLLILSDEVYAGMAYEGPPISMLSFAPERTIVIGAASKEYLIPGARVGYLISADSAFINDWAAKLVRASTSNPNTLGQRRLIELMGPDVQAMKAGQAPPLLIRIRNTLKDRRDGLIRVLQAEGLSVRMRKGIPPTGGISVLAWLPKGMDDQDVANRAMDMGLFSVVPGSAFGAPGGLRIGYGTMDQPTMARFAVNLRKLMQALTA